VPICACFRSPHDAMSQRRFDNLIITEKSHYIVVGLDLVMAIFSLCVVLNRGLFSAVRYIPSKF
jgi:hypothetical protein